MEGVLLGTVDAESITHDDVVRAFNMADRNLGIRARNVERELAETSHLVAMDIDEADAIELELTMAAEHVTSRGFDETPIVRVFREYLHGYLVAKGRREP